MSNELLTKRQESAAFIESLGKKKTALVGEADLITKTAMAETRGMTAEERTTFEAKLGEIESINETIKLQERMASNAYSDAPNPARLEVRDNVLDKPWGPEARGGETKEQRQERIELGYGEYLQSVKNASLARQDGRAIDPRLLALNEGFEKRALAAGASEMVPSDGGFLVYPEFANEILMLAWDTGLVYPRCRQLPLGEYTNAIKIPAVDEQSRKDGFRRGGIQMFWENEASALVPSRPTFTQIELVLKKLTGLYYATNELLADARLLGSLVMQFMGEELGFKLDDGVIRGTGSGQLKGILNSAALITVAKEPGQAAQTILSDNIIKMWSRLYAPLRGESAWFVNQDCEPALAGMSKVVGVGGIPVYLPPGGLSASPYATLYGRPLVTLEQCSTLGTPGDIILGGFSQYFMIAKGGLQTASSMHVRFLTDEMTYRWIYRCDGQPWWKTALTPAQGTNTLGPWVVLASR